jgi:putative ABC transport system substrate-binding protein
MNFANGLTRRSDRIILSAQDCRRKRRRAWACAFLVGVGLKCGPQIDRGNPIRRCYALVRSIHVLQHLRCGNTTLGQGGLCERWWQWNIVLIVLLLSSGLCLDDAGAAERPRLFRIGVLTESWGATPHVVGLRELGYREDQQFVIGVRFTQGDLTALPAAARELVQHGVDLLFMSQPGAAKVAQMATTQIPIVFAGVGDPIGLGLVQSFARPGGNITGVTNLDLDLSPKRLEVFRQIIPGLKRVLYPYDPTDAYSVAQARLYRDAGRRLGIELVEQAVQTEEEVQAILAQARKGDVDGVLAPYSASLNINGFILEAAPKQAIPTMFDEVYWGEQGGLTSYGPDQSEMGRQAARLVDKILKGLNPAEIPVEVNPKIEFAINLKVANALGMAIAPVSCNIMSSNRAA